MTAPRIMMVSPQKTGTHLVLELAVALGYRVFGAIRSTPRNAPQFTDEQRREIARLVLAEDEHAELLKLDDPDEFRDRTDRAWSALAWSWQRRLGQPVVNRYGQDLHDSVDRTATNPLFGRTRFAETPAGLCWIWHELDPSTVDGSFVAEWTDTGDPRMILNLRDPRDALLSLVNFIDGRTNQGIGNFYERRIYNKVLSTFDTLEQKIDYALRDRYFLAAQEFERALWLLHHPDVCVVRYEELAGPAAGGSRPAQLAAVSRVMRHVGVGGDPATYADVVYNPDSWSFHRGRIGEWRAHFTARNLRHFHERYGDICEQLGYE
jgi:hypothetical protein